MLHRKAPCSNCPFRKDVPPGEFPSDRYEALLASVGTDDEMRMPGDPLFACHKSSEGKEIACAGWLHVCGWQHLTVRLALAAGKLDRAVMDGAPDWPELFASYDEMRAVQGG